MTFGEKMRKLLEFRRLRLQELAESSGVGYNTLRSYLNPQGNLSPTAPKGIAIARALGVPAEWLFDDDCTWPPPTVALQSVEDRVFIGELYRRRADWVRKGGRLVSQYKGVKWRPVSQWCRENPPSVDPPEQIAKALVQELIAFKLEEEFDRWFGWSDMGSQLGTFAVIRRWLDRPHPPAHVYERLMILFGRLSQDDLSRRIRELLPELHAAIHQADGLQPKRGPGKRRDGKP